MDESEVEKSIVRLFYILLITFVLFGVVVYYGYPSFPNFTKVVLNALVGHSHPEEPRILVILLTAGFYFTLVFHLLYAYTIFDYKKPLKLFLVKYLAGLIWRRIKDENLKNSLVRIEGSFPTLFGISYFIISFSIFMLGLKAILLFLPISAHSELTAVVWLTHIDVVGVSLAILGCLLAVAITIIVEMKKDEDSEKLNHLINDMKGALSELKEVHGNFKPLNSFEERLDYLINFIEDVKKNHPHNEIILANYNIGYGALQSFHLNSIKRYLSPKQTINHGELEAKFLLIKAKVKRLFNLIEESNSSNLLNPEDGSLFERLKIIALRSDANFSNPSAYSNWLFNFLKEKEIKIFGRGTVQITEDLSQKKMQDSFVVFNDKEFECYEKEVAKNEAAGKSFLNSYKSKMIEVAFRWNMSIINRLRGMWSMANCEKYFNEVSYLPMPFFVTYPKPEAIQKLISENGELYYRSLVVFTDVNDHPLLDHQFYGFVSNKSDVAINLKSLYEGLLKDSKIYEANQAFIKNIFFGGASSQSVVIKAIDEDNILNKEQARLSYMDDLKCYSLVKDLCSDYGIHPEETYDKDLVGNCSSIPKGQPLNNEIGYLSIGLFGNEFLYCLMDKNEVPFKLTREEKKDKDANGKESITFYGQKIYFDESYSEQITDPNIDYAIFAHYDLCYPVTIVGGLTSKTTSIFGAYLKRNFPMVIQDFEGGDFDTLIYEVNISQKSVKLRKAFKAMRSSEVGSKFTPLGVLLDGLTTVPQNSLPLVPDKKTPRKGRSKRAT